MEISDNMVLYVVIGAVLISAIIVTRGEVIWRALVGIGGCLTWILGGLAVLGFVATAIFLAIPDPVGLEVWMAALSTLLVALAKFAHNMGNLVDRDNVVDLGD